MTATDAIWTQGGSFTAAEDRSLISALMGARHFTDLAPGISKVDAGGGHGVVDADDLEVTPGAGHSVDVAAGQAFVRGTQSAGQGAYLVGNDATLNLAVSTPDATNDRIDLVQIRVSDDSAGAGVTTIDVKAGTPAGSPSAPTPDENCLVLATVLVPASAASSASYTITDRRTRAAALGGIIPVASTASLPSPASDGQSAYLLDSNHPVIYDGTTWRGLIPTVHQTSAISGSGIGGTETILGTLVVPALPFPTRQVSAAYWSGSGTTGDQFALRIRDTNTSGTTRAQARLGVTDASTAHGSFPAGEVRSVAANTSATYVLTVQRISGAGTIATLVSPHHLTVTSYPDLS